MFCNGYKCLSFGVSLTYDDVNTIEKTDPSGDVSGMNPISPYKENIDVKHINTSLDGDTIVLEFTVEGVIILDTGSNITQSYGYTTYIDTNGDADDDWEVRSGNGNAALFGYNTGIVSGDGNTMYTNMNASGNGTTTYHFSFPLSYISSGTSFNIYVESEFMDLGQGIIISDETPDDRYWGGLDLDEDGMPNGWEEDYGLDPYTYDAEEDPDEDGYCNIEEYQADTHSTPSSHPGTSGGSLNTNIHVKLLFPLIGIIVAVLIVAVILYIIKGKRGQENKKGEM